MGTGTCIQEDYNCLFIFSKQNDTGVKIQEDYNCLFIFSKQNDTAGKNSRRLQLLIHLK
jgi:hypothetical protein